MKNILILGNLGYIGPVLTQYLRKKYPNSRLIGFDMGLFLNNYTTRERVPESYLDAQYFGDVRNFPIELLEQTHAIVALAAISNDPMGNRFEKPTMDINCHALVQLAEKAKKAGVSAFVFASSCSVYGFAESGERDETAELNPLTAYARSKVLAEQKLEPLADRHFKVTCLRFATACGSSPRLRLDLVLNDFVASALTTGTIQILSDGKPWRPLIHVQDMSRAIDWALHRNDETSPFITVNAGSNHWNFQVFELANAVKKAIPLTSVLINKDALPDKRSYKVDFSQFAALAPDYQPIHTLDSTINGLIDSLEQIGFNDAQFRTSDLIRLHVLNRLVAQNALNEQLEYL